MVKKQKWTEQDFIDFGIPERYASATFKEIRDHTEPGNKEYYLFMEQQAVAFQAGQDPKTSACAYGTAGNAKTHCLYALARAVIFKKWRERGWVSSRYYSHLELMDEPLREGGESIFISNWITLLKEVDNYRRRRSNAPNYDPIDHLTNCKRIFIDDFTVQQSGFRDNVDSPYIWQKDITYEIMNALWERKPGTFTLYITSQNTRAEMISAWGIGTIDRLRAITKGFEIKGLSHRQSPREQEGNE